MCELRSERAVRKKIACNKLVFVHPSSYTLQLLHHVYETLKKLGREKININHSMTILINKNCPLRRLGSEHLKNSQTSSFHVHLDLPYYHPRKHNYRCKSLFYSKIISASKKITQLFFAGLINSKSIMSA